VETEAAVSYKGFRFPAEIIAHAVWLYHRFPLSYREGVVKLSVSGLAEGMSGCGGAGGGVVFRPRRTRR
jgi:hypothetical protein